MKILYIILFISLFFSCQKKLESVELFYPNGNLKEKYQIDSERQIQGVYYKYYETKKIKEKHIFDNGVNIDSSVYYSESGEKILRKWNDSIVLNKIYDNQGNLIAEGLSIRNDLKFKIRKWKYFDSNKLLDSVVEYVNFDNEPYPNQIWIIDKKRDTLEGRGNYFHLKVKDTVNLGEIIKLDFFLKTPFYGYDSDVKVLLASVDKENSDFSNLFKQDFSVALSLKNDKIEHPELPEDFPENHYVSYGIPTVKTGLLTLMGAVIEYVEDKSSKKEKGQYERILFFKQQIVINPDGHGQ